MSAASCSLLCVPLGCHLLSPLSAARPPPPTLSLPPSVGRCPLPHAVLPASSAQVHMADQGGAESGQLNPKTNPKSMTKSKDPAWKNCYWPGLNKMMKSTWLKMMNKYMILVNPHVTALLKMVRKLMQSWMILILMIFEQFSLSAFC
jgi:hypothetical protein